MKIIIILVSIFLTCPFEGRACVAPTDVFVLYENGRPVSTPMSFMIEEDKTNSQMGGWLPCMPGACGKIRGQPSVSGGINELVLCKMPGDKPFFSADDWSSLTDSPAKVCQKKEWPCTLKLYNEYVKTQAKTCKRISILLPAGSEGKVPFAKINYPKGHTPGPGEGCGRDIRCFDIDVVKKTARSCSPDEMKKLFAYLN